MRWDPVCGLFKYRSKRTGNDNLVRYWAISRRCELASARRCLNSQQLVVQPSCWHRWGIKSTVGVPRRAVCTREWCVSGDWLWSTRDTSTSILQHPHWCAMLCFSRRHDLPKSIERSTPRTKTRHHLRPGHTYITLVRLHIYRWCATAETGHCHGQVGWGNTSYQENRQ